MKKFGAKKIGALAVALALVTVGGVYATWSFNSSASGASGGGSITVGIADYEINTASSTGSYTVATKTEATNVSKVYTVDQYSSAITNIYQSSYTTRDYDYVIVMHDNVTYYIFDNSGTISYYTSADSTIVSGTPDSAGINDHTAALCIAHNASITITYKNTDSGASAYTQGVDTQFAFSWASGDAPSITVDSLHYYSASSATEADVLGLRTESMTIYSTSTAVTGELQWDDGTTQGDGILYCTLSGEQLFKTYLWLASEVIIDTTTAYDVLSSTLSGDNVKITVSETSGTALTVPTVTANTGVGTLSVNNSNYSSSDLSTIYLGLMSDASSATAEYLYECDGSTDVTVTISTWAASLTGGMEDGTYYVRARAIAAGTSTYANSLWSTAAYTVTVTTVSGVTSYTVASI